MIGKLWGEVDAVFAEGLVIKAGYVGYDVSCSGKSLEGLKRGDDVVLFIDTHVREDSIKLYGFATDTERTMFRLLQTVQGVGAKVALAFLTMYTPSEVAGAIHLGDKAMITQTSGVGPKLADRIVVELKSKVLALATDTALIRTMRALPVGASDAISALHNLGYSREVASTAVAAVVERNADPIPTEKLIRLALKDLSQ